MLLIFHHDFRKILKDDKLNDSVAGLVDDLDYLLSIVSVPDEPEYLLFTLLFVLL